MLHFARRITGHWASPTTQTLKPAQTLSTGLQEPRQIINSNSSLLHTSVRLYTRDARSGVNGRPSRSGPSGRSSRPHPDRSDSRSTMERRFTKPSFGFKSRRDETERSGQELGSFRTDRHPSKPSFFKKPKILDKKPVPTAKLSSEVVDRLENALKKKSVVDVEENELRERVAKRVARCGLCSRREAERWIMMGRVSVDGKIVDELGATVSPGQQLAVDNIPIRAEAPKLFIFNKVRNMLITRATNDEKNRDTLGQLLTEMGDPTLLPVGRLDYSSEGLLLLTNDGELKRYLEHPDSNILRVYRVRVFGRVRQEKFDGLEKGIEINGFKYKGVSVTVENQKDRSGPTPAPQWRVAQSGQIPKPEERANTWLKVELREGKNREIRNIMEYFGLEVSRLIRIQYGPYKLTPDIESGIVKPVAITTDLKAHTNQHWDWHADQVEPSSTRSSASRLKVPKSNPPPTRKPQPQQQQSL